jgi:hypothetical protein
VSAELLHEGLAESADLVVALALGVEVGTTLATADVETGQGVLEDLLEAEELQAVGECVSAGLLLPAVGGTAGRLGQDLHGQVDGGVEAEAALIGTQSRVELNAETAVDLEGTAVILPDDTEVDDALGDSGDLQGGSVLGVLSEKGRVLESRSQFTVGLCSTTC